MRTYIIKNRRNKFIIGHNGMYKAKSWPYERRVVCKVEKPENQMVTTRFCSAFLPV